MASETPLRLTIVHDDKFFRDLGDRGGDEQQTAASEDDDTSRSKIDQPITEDLEQ